MFQKRTKKILSLISFVLVCELAGIIGSIFTTSSINSWYSTLLKPAFNPPNWLFGPVWTSLYALMGISAFLVWQKGWESQDIKSALYTFFFQLILNSFWSIIFFGVKSPGLAFIEIITLLGAIILTMKKFWPISFTAFWLMLPYLIWVTFATYLNYSIWVLNK